MTRGSVVGVEGQAHNLDNSLCSVGAKTALKPTPES